MPCPRQNHFFFFFLEPLPPNSLIEIKEVSCNMANGKCLKKANPKKNIHLRHTQTTPKTRSQMSQKSHMPKSADPGWSTPRWDRIRCPPRRRDTRRRLWRSYGGMWRGFEHHQESNLGVFCFYISFCQAGLLGYDPRGFDPCSGHSFWNRVSIMWHGMSHLVQGKTLRLYFHE